MIEILDLNHVTLVVRDVAAARRFYGEVLGLTEVASPPSATHSTYWFRRGSAEIHLVPRSDAVQDPGDTPHETDTGRDQSLSRHLALQIADMDAAVATLQAAGVPTLLGPRLRGDGAGQLFCYDPDGHLVELTTLPAK